MAVDLAVNYLAVVVAAVAAVVIGIVYYGLAGLGDRLARLVGSTPVGRPGPAQLAVGVVVSLVNAWVLALLALNLGASSLTDGVVLGVLVWLGFMATLSGAQVAFQGRPWNAWLITSVHDVVVQVVMAAILTLWR